MIVSTLDQVKTKYPNHPKTPYVKKGRRGKFGKKGDTAEKPAAKKVPSKKAKKIAQPAYKLSPELSSLLGHKELSRPEVTKQLWVYIKSHNLQDPKDKRLIRPDAALAKVFGSKAPVNMMKLAGLLNKHLKK